MRTSRPTSFLPLRRRFPGSAATLGVPHLGRAVRSRCRTWKFETTLFVRENPPEVCMQTGTTLLHLAHEVLLLAKRPTRVAKILKSADPWPRTVETATQPGFIAAKKASPEIFQREVRRRP